MCLQCEYVPRAAKAVEPLDIVVLRRDHAQRGMVMRRNGSFITVQWADQSVNTVAVAEVIRLGRSSFAVERRAVAR